MTNERFTVINHEYINTGGNTMVSVFTVYDYTDNASRYVIIGENGFSWQTADTISNPDFSLDNDEMIEKIVLGSWTFDALTTEPCWDQHLFEDDEWQLFKYCQFEHYKKDCKYYNYKVELSIKDLPNDLYSTLSAEYIEWSNKNNASCWTDGYQVFLNDEYEPPFVEANQKLQAVKDFQAWLNDYVRYNEVEFGATSSITIAVSGDSVKIPLHADSLEWLNKFLAEAIANF